MESFEPVLESLEPDKMSPQMQMSVANALLQVLSNLLYWYKSTNTDAARVPAGE
jgi:hypothetical protein